MYNVTIQVQHTNPNVKGVQNFHEIKKLNNVNI